MARAIPSDFTSANINYRNGKIPACALKTPRGFPETVKLHPQASEQLEKLVDAAQRAGIQFTIGSSYRPYEVQVKTKFNQGKGAATPGSSMHGWGTAIDISELYREAESRANEVNRGKPPAQRVDKFNPSVHQYIRDNNPLYKWLVVNAPKYGWVNPEWARDGQGAVDECWHWEYQGWPVLPTTVPAQNRPRVRDGKIESEVVSRCAPDTGFDVPSFVRSTTVGRPSQPNVSPYIGSLASFHPKVQYELTRRRISSETANVYMPFVRLTSLTEVLPDNLLDGGKAWCPSLGPHGQDNIEFTDIYLPKDNRSIIGYATSNKPNSGTEEFIPNRVPVIVSSSVMFTEQKNIPMPGILEVSAEKGTAGPMGVRGGLMKVDVKIAAYSVGQVDALLRYFLRPATRVVLEWGRKSSNVQEPFVPYDWGKPADQIADEFSKLITDADTQTELIERHIYGSNGNYEVFIGYVVKFDLKYNKNNVYEIGLTIHSIQQYEISTKHTSVKSLCPDSTSKCSAMDILEYFAEEYSWKEKTFKKLMSNEIEKSKATDYVWRDDFIALKNAEATPAPTGAGSPTAGMDETEYYVSWRFFVEKILNDENFGIASLIDDPDTRKFIKMGLIRPTSEEITVTTDGLIANEVGYHPDLRSTDPNIMVIYNETAQIRRTLSEELNFQNLIDASLTTREERSNFSYNTAILNLIQSSSVGSFRNTNTPSEQNKPAVGLLTQGVWINTKAIKQAFTNTDTVSSAVNSLLMMMNTATEGYWNLQLYSAERPNPGLFVIDMGVSKKLSVLDNSTQVPGVLPGIDNETNELENLLTSITQIDLLRYQKSNDVTGSREPKYIYMFNRGTKTLSDGDLGSDLLDLNVEFNLPQVVAVQAIAGVGGPAQKSTLQSINIPELNSITLIKNIFTSCNTQSICVNEECNDGDLQKLKAAWDVASTEANAIGLTAQQTIRTADGNEGAFLVGALQGMEATIAQRSASIQEDAYNRALIQRTHGNLMIIDTVRELSSLGTLLKLVEFNPGTMMKKLNIDSTNAEDGRPTSIAHAFNSSNLTKTIATVTLPGIGGVELFQSFLIDRVPSILERGFYVVTKIVHKFSSNNGWITTLEGRFRYRPTENITQPTYTRCEGAQPTRPTPQSSTARTPFDAAFPQFSTTSTSVNPLAPGSSPASIGLTQALNSLNQPNQAQPQPTIGPQTGLRVGPDGRVLLRP